MSLSGFCGDGHCENSHGNRLMRVVDETITRLKYSAPVFWWKVHELQQPCDIPANSIMTIRDF